MPRMRATQGAVVEQAKAGPGVYGGLFFTTLSTLDGPGSHKEPGTAQSPTPRTTVSPTEYSKTSSPKSTEFAQAGNSKTQVAQPPYVTPSTRGSSPRQTAY